MSRYHGNLTIRLFFFKFYSIALSTQFDITMFWVASICSIFELTKLKVECLKPLAFWAANLIAEFQSGLRERWNICRKNQNHLAITCWQRKCKLWFSVFNLSHSSLRDVKFDKNCSASYETKNHGLTLFFFNICAKFYFTENWDDFLRFVFMLVCQSSVNLKTKSLNNLSSLATCKN